MQILGFFNICFHSLKGLPLFLELHKTLFIDPFCILKETWKILNFLTKTMVLPLWKNANFMPFLNRFFSTQIQLLFVLTH